MPQCGFSSCTHTVEPNCAVMKGVESGVVDPDRYESYLALFETLESDS